MTEAWREPAIQQANDVMNIPTTSEAPRARGQLTFKLRAVAADSARGKDNLRSRRYRKIWPHSILLSLIMYKHRMHRIK